jgi:MCP family monocarboxylic acid transporter-like MFS transporter 10
MTLISGLLCLALWLPSNGNTPIIVYCILYGLFSGQYVSLLPAYLARISPQPVFGARLGAVYTVAAVANLVGTPTAGGLVEGGSEDGFRHLIGFTGAMVTIGGLFMGCAWLLEARRIYYSTPKEKLSFRSFNI